MKYELNISLTESVLDTIAKAHQRIILVKHTAGDNDTPVAWVGFKPWMNNTVEWENNFAIYASNTEVRSGATISKLSDKQAATGECYAFSEGYFHKPVSGENLPKNSYVIENQNDDTDGITVGLAQDVVVNGEAFERNPINAVFVPRGQFATMTPIERIDVYLKNDIVDSTVISHIQSKALTVEYGEGESVHTLKYNDVTGQFYLDN